MGLNSKGCYAKVWKIDRKERYTQIQASISKKIKDTDQYETDWSGFINLVGQAHQHAANLKEGDRIKIEEFDVTTRHNKEKNVTYTNYAVFKYSAPNAENTQDSSAKSPDTPVEGSPEDLPF
jgi:hypothetical protein